ncbi:MAG: hypothetical protein M8467_14625 [Anaerolineae bacterium]|nr:hypothetical protein [Anaerolineae bacterium]
MEDTYTYTARSIEYPERAVTFTLHDHHMSVEMAAPVEQVERMLAAREGEEEGEFEDESKVWLKPLAVSLLERGVGPFRLEDVYPLADEDRLRVKAWYRAGGLGLLPVTLLDGRVDNPDAAEAFVAEIGRRKEEFTGATGFLSIMDYWITWFAAGFLFFGLLSMWRRKA